MSRRVVGGDGVLLANVGETRRIVDVAVRDYREAVRRAVEAGVPHVRIAECAGVSRARIGQMAKEFDG